VSPRLFAALLACLAPALLASPASAQRGEASRPENGEEINLAVGEARTISARDVKNYSEGVAGIVDIKLTTDNLNFVINGRRPGSTTLLLIKNDGTQITLNINVFVRAPNVVERELAQLLEGVQGIRVRRVGARIVIDGSVPSEGHLKRVQQLAAMYPNQVEALATIAGRGGAGGGPVDDRKYIIRIDFYFVQFDRSSQYNVGLGWPASIGGPDVIKTEFAYDFVTSSTRSATAQVVNQPIPRLDIASRKGWAKVLKQATVIANNGAEASFQNGGEQLFPVNQGLTIGIQRVQFGSDLSVVTRFDPLKRDLDMKIVADVSDLTAAISGTPLPGRNTSRLSTSVSLKLGQSLVLSGIRTKSQTRNNAGLPFLSDIPILGLLFGSQANSELETEGAILVVPTVVATVPTQGAEMVESALAKFRNYDGNVNTINAFDKRPGGTLTIPEEKK